ncbi:SRPBCC domain-containing protein [uncultured Phenylobacterium sp.]|uniref:SRPBCC family protein n=1 Tax=uncultured Phenylobacterium sp. TaxID=349273 RepID=UPI0025F581E9|nr:SRPBCC domain-containing protein [uncultured Phenylobacterium sp.]
MKHLIATVLTVLTAAGSAQAAVVDKGPGYFRLKTVQQIAAPPAKVYAAIGEWGRWWSDAHTYSGKASNITLALSANGCLCEALPGGGSVRHGVVELVIPNQTVRLDAAFGPLQDEGVGGAYTLTLKARDGGTELTMTYHVAGARDFIVSAAPAIDEVMSEGVGRLKAYVETGRP